MAEPDDSFEPEMTGEEAFERAMRIKLQDNRAARATLKASERLAQRSDRPGTPNEPRTGGRSSKVDVATPSANSAGK